MTEFSVSKTFEDALVEWEWTEKCINVLPEKGYVCELCEKENIKWRFEIYNDYNCEDLLICRSCLKKYIRRIYFWVPLSKEEILSKVKDQQQSARADRKYYERVEAGANLFGFFKDPPSRH